MIFSNQLVIPITKLETSFPKLNQPFRKTNDGQEGLSYLAPIVWNRLPNSLKAKEGINIHKPSVKNIA